MNMPKETVFRRIYDALADDISRRIYRHRLLYSLLGENEEISALAGECLPADVQTNGVKHCYYGAGVGGYWLIQNERDVPFIIDKYKTGTLDGIPIISLKDFLEQPDYKNYLVIIAVSKPDIRDEIAAELSDNGIHYVLGYPGLQYFDLPELNFQNEYFVDVGAEDGDTTRYFLDHFENGYAYVFEPNPKQFEITVERLKRYHQAEVFPYGAYDEDTTLRFDLMDGLRGSSKVSESGSVAVEVRRLDDLLRSRKVTYIKMDIEGSELAALRGAEQIIRTQKPKLAICVYHKPEDIWEIPEQILQYREDYKLYLRHYSLSNIETVLYAV